MPTSCSAPCALAGGLEAQQKLNEKKAKILYDAIDQSNGFYVNPVAREDRSLMNVPFTIPTNPDLEKAFTKETEKLGLVSWGGISYVIMCWLTVGCTPGQVPLEVSICCFLLDPTRIKACYATSLVLGIRVREGE